MKAVPSKGKIISLLKIFVHEERTKATMIKKSNERSVVQASDVIGLRLPYDSFVSIGKRECMSPEDKIKTSPILVSERFFMIESIAKFRLIFLYIAAFSETVILIPCLPTSI